MIQQEQIMPLLLTACPGFGRLWADHLAYWNGKPAGIFLDTAEFVHYLADCHERNDITALTAAFQLIERFFVEGEENTKEVAAMGILETLQNVASHQPEGAAPYLSYLGPRSRTAWDAINALWEGKQNLADVIRSERSRDQS